MLYSLQSDTRSCLKVRFEANLHKTIDIFSGVCIDDIAESGDFVPRVPSKAKKVPTRERYISLQVGNNLNVFLLPCDVIRSHLCWKRGQLAYWLNKNRCARLTTRASVPQPRHVTTWSGGGWRGWQAAGKHEGARERAHEWHPEALDRRLRPTHLQQRGEVQARQGRHLLHRRGH